MYFKDCPGGVDKMDACKGVILQIVPVRGVGCGLEGVVCIGLGPLVAPQPKAIEDSK